MKSIVLASKSASRAAILRSAGVLFETASSGVDEDAVKARMLAEGSGPREVAERLADAKALTVSQAHPGALVVGGDQTLDLSGRLFDKVDDLGSAHQRLLELRGRTHILHSAVVVAEAGKIVWRTTESPSLAMRDFTDAYLEGYLARGGEALLGSVGCYLLEGEGAQLFERIEGDYFAVLGLPLLPLLDALRRLGGIAA